MKFYKGVGAIFLLLSLPIIVAAQEQGPINNEIVTSILQKAYPELEAGQIEIKYIKRLRTRVKVNLEIKGDNAVLYLTWQKSRGRAFWWFEHDAERSLVYLSKSAGTARPKPAATTEVAKTSVAGAVRQTPRTETIEVKAEVKREKVEAEKPETETKQPEAEKTAEKELKEEEQEVLETKTTKQEKQQKPEEIPPAEVKPVEDEPKEIVAEKTEETVRETETAREDAVTESKTEVEAESPVEVPLEVAVGANATPKQFLAAFVVVLTRGSENNYQEFVLRKEEFVVKVSPENYDHVVSMWKDRCRRVHGILKGHKNIAIEKIVLQRPPGEAAESEMLKGLRRMVPGAKEVYSTVKVNLFLDGKRFYILIGGMLRVTGGWRIGGRMDIMESQVIDIQ